MISILIDAFKALTIRNGCHCIKRKVSKNRENFHKTNSYASIYAKLAESGVAR